MRRRAASSLLALALALGAGAALAQAQSFDVWDKDGDGRISPAEFAGGPGGLRSTETPAAAPEVETVEAPPLAEHDLDGDGRLAEAEFRRAAANEGLGDDFSDWDANGDGEIDISEWRAGYYVSGPAPASLGVDQGRRAAEARYDFANWDANGDGRLDAQEFARVRAEFNLLDDLSALDADGDGALSPDEYARLPRRTQYRGGAAPTDQSYWRFEDWDRDGDGFLSREEYAGFDAGRVDAASGGLLAQMDANGDGLVERQEFQGWTERRAGRASGMERPDFTTFDRDKDGVLDGGELIGVRNALRYF